MRRSVWVGSCCTEYPPARRTIRDMLQRPPSGQPRLRGSCCIFFGGLFLHSHVCWPRTRGRQPRTVNNQGMTKSVSNIIRLWSPLRNMLCLQQACRNICQASRQRVPSQHDTGGLSREAVTFPSRSSRHRHTCQYVARGQDQQPPPR